MPHDLNFLHLAAIAFLFASWILYSPFMARFARGSLNSQLGVVRLHWVQLEMALPGWGAVAGLRACGSSVCLRLRWRTQLYFVQLEVHSHGGVSLLSLCHVCGAFFFLPPSLLSPPPPPLPLFKLS